MIVLTMSSPGQAADGGWSALGYQGWGYYDGSWLGWQASGCYEYKFAKYVFMFTNQERSKIGLSQLKWSNALATMSYMHSSQMFGTGVFDHNSTAYFRPGYQTMQERAAQVGASYYGLENIAYLPQSANVLPWQTQYGTKSWDMMMTNTHYDTWAKVYAGQVLKGWMNSPDHKAHILDAKATYLGVGFRHGYVTQLFSNTVGTMPTIASSQWARAMSVETGTKNGQPYGLYTAYEFFGSKYKSFFMPHSYITSWKW